MWYFVVGVILGLATVAILLALLKVSGSAAENVLREIEEQNFPIWTVLLLIFVITMIAWPLTHVGGAIVWVLYRLFTKIFKPKKKKDEKSNDESPLTDDRGRPWGM